MTKPENAIVELPPSAVVAAATFAERTLAERTERCLSPSPTNVIITPRVLLVDPTDPACYPTIAAAVADAQPTERVRVRPGRYRESIVLDKAVSVEGDRDRDATVVEAANGPCFVVSAAGARIANLTLTGGGTGPMDLPNALALAADAVIERVVIRGIDVAGASPTIRDCVVTVGRHGSGISVHDGASPTIESNLITGNECNDTCVAVRGAGSNPLIRGNTVKDGDCGISVHDGATPRIESNDVFSNAVSIRVLNSSPTIHDNRLGGGYIGISVSGAAEPTIENNDISECCNIGIWVSGVGTDPVVRHNKVHDSDWAAKDGVSTTWRDGNGIRVSEGASPTIEFNEVYGYVKAGISVNDPGSVPLIRGNTVRDSTSREHGVGISVTKDATPTIENNVLYGNPGGDIDTADAGSQVAVRNNTVRHA